MWTLSFGCEHTTSVSWLGRVVFPLLPLHWVTAIPCQWLPFPHWADGRYHCHNKPGSSYRCLTQKIRLVKLSISVLESWYLSPWAMREGDMTVTATAPRGFRFPAWKQPQATSTPRWIHATAHWLLWNNWKGKFQVNHYDVRALESEYLV